jgi:predicted flap endonuclease-1-like 5' DNA nuclease
MGAGIALLAGVIIGWIIEWVIDWQYWRRGISGFYATEAQLRSELAQAKTALDASAAEVESTRQELHTARAQLQASKVREAELQRRVDAAALGTAAEPIAKSSPVGASVQSDLASASDDLTRIDGIGLQQMERMREAGVTTFALLAVATPQQLEEIVRPATWQHFDYEMWRRRAKELAAMPLTDEGKRA